MGVYGTINGRIQATRRADQMTEEYQSRQDQERSKVCAFLRETSHRYKHQ